MLKEFLNSINFYDITPDRNFFHPISDREYWDGFAEKYLDEIVERYEKITAEPRGELTASLYLDYVRRGNRSCYEKAYGRRRDELLLATLIECCRNDGALMDDILDLTWMILEETSWCMPAHNKASATIADVLPYYKQWTITICSTGTAVKLAFVYQVMGEKLDEISKMVTMRIREVISEKVLSEMLNRDDIWWMGFGDRKPNNIGIWNWRNAMIAALIVVDDMDFLRKFILKAIICMDQYIDNQGEEGGCNEGPSYWFHSHGNVIEAIEVMNRATNGAFTDCFKSEKIRNMSKFLLKMYTGGKYFVNFADGSPVLEHGALFVYRCGKILEIPEVCDFAAEWGKATGQTSPLGGKPVRKAAFVDGKSSAKGRPPVTGAGEMYHVLENLKYYDEYMEHTPSETKASEFYLADLGVMTVRTQSENGEIFLGAKAGHNAESHNHNDVGNFIVYKNGERFIVDSGPLEYSALTFSEKRYTLWTNRSEYHNVPTIDGYNQLNTPKGTPKNEGYRSENAVYEKGEDESSLSTSIKNAYENRDEIKAFDRRIAIDKKTGTVTVADSFDTGKEAPVTWNFLTQQKPEWDGEKILLTAENGEMLEIIPCGADFAFTGETVDYDDDSMRAKWGDKLYRVLLSARVNKGTVSFEIK